MAATTEREDMTTTTTTAPGDDDRNDRESRPPIEYKSPSSAQGGFFHLYKSGQGYWTRMGTAAAAALIALVTANFIYFDLGGRIQYLAEHRGLRLGIAGAFLVVFGLFVWWLVNRPRNADFLIATDSEMKKVNWTSRKELIGSTKIVILFMFLIAFGLFAIDILFGYLFYFMNVLKNPPL